MTSMCGTKPSRQGILRLLWPHQYHLVLFLCISLVSLSGTLYSLYYHTHVFNTQYSAIRALDFASAKAMQKRVPSIFADRRNWINVFFIKQAWFWNTLDVALIALTLDRTSGGLRGENKRAISGQGPVSHSQSLGIQAFWRWLEATIGWGA